MYRRWRRCKCSIRRTLDRQILRQVQTLKLNEWTILQVRVCKRFKFYNSFSRHRCYMLTLLLALTYIGEPQMRTGGPFGTIPQELWHRKRVRHNAKPVPLSSSLREYAHLYKLKISQNSGELRPPRDIFLSIKRNYHLLTYIKL